LCDADASSPPTWCTCHRLQFSVLFDASRAVDSAVLFVMLGAVRCDMCFHRCWSALLVRPSLVRRCAQCMAGAVCCGCSERFDGSRAGDPFALIEMVDALRCEMCCQLCSTRALVDRCSSCRVHGCMVLCAVGVGGQIPLFRFRCMCSCVLCLCAHLVCLCAFGFGVVLV